MGDIKRYIDTYKAGKSYNIVNDLEYIYESFTNDIDVGLVQEFLKSLKKIKLSYRVIGVDKFGTTNVFLCIYIIHSKGVCTMNYYYDEFLRFKRDYIINKINN